MYRIIPKILLESILGGQEFPFEHRIQNLALCISLIVSAVFSCFLAFIEIDQSYRILIILAILIFSICYYISRIQRNFILSLIISSVFEVILVLNEWLHLSGGLDASLMSMILTSFISKPFLIPKKYHIHAFIFYSSIVSLFLFFDVHLSNNIPDYIVLHNPADRIQMLFYFGFIAFIIFFFKSEYIKKLKEADQAKFLLNNTLTKEKELNNIKTEFIQMVSHQFKTPLTSIYSSAELLNLTLKKEGIDSPKNRLKVERIYDAVNLMTGMMEKLLVFEKMGTENLTVNKSQVDCLALLKECTEKFSTHTESQFSISVSYLAPQKNVFLDKTLFSEILYQLFENASKFTKENKLINIDVCYMQQDFKVRISDKGIGIPEDDIPQIFEPFYRGKNAKNINGNGIGLVFVKKFMHLHKGSIKVVSTEEKGTTFKLSIPYQVEA